MGKWEWYNQPSTFFWGHPTFRHFGYFTLGELVPLIHGKLAMDPQMTEGQSFWARASWGWYQLRWLIGVCPEIADPKSPPLQGSAVACCLQRSSFLFIGIIEDMNTQVQLLSLFRSERADQVSKTQRGTLAMVIPGKSCAALQMPRSSFLSVRVPTGNCEYYL